MIGNLLAKTSSDAISVKIADFGLSKSIEGTYYKSTQINTVSNCHFILISLLLVRLFDGQRQNH